MDSQEIYAGFKRHGGVVDLSDRAKLCVSGADRVRFLNGQISNDVRKASPGESIHACVMTAKGRMCADIFVSAAADFLHLDAEASLRESLAARLGRYIIADDVSLEDVTDAEGLLHVIGATVDGIPEAAVNGATVVRSSRFGKPGVDLLAAREHVGELLDALSSQFVVLDGDMIESVRVEGGVPRWGFELTEETIPVEAGLDKTAIDYQKGCYVGQEVISRLRSIGHVNKELRGFIASNENSSPSNAFISSNMRLFLRNNPEKEIGWITSAAYGFGLARSVALGYLKRGITDTVLLARAAGAPAACLVEVRELPIIP